MDFRVYGENDLVKVYSKSPDTFVNFVKTYRDRIDFDNKDLVALYRKAKRKKDKQDFLELLRAKIEKSIQEQRKFDFGLRDSELIALDELIDVLPKPLRKDFGDMLVKTFAYAYSRGERYWSDKYRYGPRRGECKFLTKTKFKEMINKHLDNGIVDPMYLIKMAADAVPPNVLRGFIKRVPSGLENEKLKKILRGTEKYCALGYGKKDLENASRRRALLRKIVKNSELAKRLVEPVMFKVSDIRAVSPEKRLMFFRYYYKNNDYNHRIEPGGFGRRVKFERDCTYDEVENLLFPLVIREHRGVGSFLNAYKSFSNRRNKK